MYRFIPLESSLADRYRDEVEIERASVSKAFFELSEAVSDFRIHYRKFTETNQLLINIEDDVQDAISKAEAEKDVQRAAQVFGTQLAVTLRTLEEKKQLSTTKWSGKLRNFLTKLYPLASLSLTLTGAISEVSLSVSFLICREQVFYH